ncbi:MAG: tripartite tricarboxylate transporter TctB family protein [Lachnospiraceae bacterium]
MKMDDKRQPYKPGERGFAVVLLSVGIYFLWESLKLYRKAPGAESYGAVPLFVSGLIVAISIGNIISDCYKNRFLKQIDDKKITSKQQVKRMLHYTMPKDMVIILLFMVLYCVALFAGMGFLISTPMFLWGSMCYLTGKNYGKNLIWTALSMGFIVIIFDFVFHVVLP